MPSIMEELGYYKKLQKLFDIQMGSYRVGDIVYYNDIGTGIIINASHPSMLKIKFGSCPDEWFPKKREYIRIPLVIDSLNPSRGMFGMLTKFFRLQYTKNQPTDKPKAILPSLEYAHNINDLTNNGQPEPYEGDSIEMVVLKALVAQENVR